jgi:hypothetical protein
MSMRLDSEVAEVLIGEIARSRDFAAETEPAYDDVSIEVLDIENVETTTLPFTRISAPYERIELGIATIKGAGFPAVMPVKKGNATLTGTWFRVGEQTLAKLEDIVPPKASVWPWVGVAVGVASLLAGAIIWFA